MKALKFILSRAREPSSWAGLGGALMLVGISLDPGTLQTVVTVGTGLASLLAMALKDK